MRNSAKTRQRIDEVLELVDLTRQARDACRKYSLGMKQRLAIGMALLTDPELVLLDEPTNGLDPMGVHEMRQMILRLAESGKTVILSSHLLYEVQQVCNRVVVIGKGRVLADASPKELIALKGLPSLERVFAQLVEQQDTRSIAGRIVDVMRIAHG